MSKESMLHGHPLLIPQAASGYAGPAMLARLLVQTDNRCVFLFTAISDVCSEFRKLRFREDHRKICVQHVTHV